MRRQEFNLCYQYPSQKYRQYKGQDELVELKMENALDCIINNFIENLCQIKLCHKYDELIYPLLF